MLTGFMIAKRSENEFNDLVLCHFFSSRRFVAARKTRSPKYRPVHWGGFPHVRGFSPNRLRQWPMSMLNKAGNSPARAIYLRNSISTNSGHSFCHFNCLQMTFTKSPKKNCNLMNRVVAESIALVNFASRLISAR
jgi:hypothetical protein